MQALLLFFYLNKILLGLVHVPKKRPNWISVSHSKFDIEKLPLICPRACMELGEERKKLLFLELVAIIPTITTISKKT